MIVVGHGSRHRRRSTSEKGGCSRSVEGVREKMAFLLVDDQRLTSSNAMCDDMGKL